MKTINASYIPKRFAIAECEAAWRKKWDEWTISRSNVVSKSRSFVIDSPPPTVSGSLHVGHLFSYTHQDLIARYRRMTGWNVVYPMGWDDNGLPTERRVQNLFAVRTEPNVPYIENFDIEVERQRLGLGKDQQLVISRRNFIELCHRVTKMDESVFKELFRRMGFSINWENEYATIDYKSQRIAQRSFLDLYEKGHVYQLEAPTMWDVDFQTAVSQAEVEEREVLTSYYDIEFSVHEGDTSVKSFVISTTRPELLPACVGVAAHPEDRRFQGLFGKHAITPVYFARVPIFPSELVDPGKGTGILMICTFGDQTDVQWWREQNLELRQILGRDGRVLQKTFGDSGWSSLRPEQANARFKELVGKPISAARKIVVAQLADPINSLLGDKAPLHGKPREIKHPVRYYEKGYSPLEYLTTRQWFVRLLDKKDRLLEMGDSIAWHPDFMRKRYRNWTDNLMLDWCISRQRYFGVPIPIWYPLDTAGQPLYDQPILAPEEMFPVDPGSTPPPGYTADQLHQPGGYEPESDVFDTWFTSSLTPQIVAGWGEGAEDKMSELFPMCIRPQSHEIIRTWTFYTIAKAMLHQDKVPWYHIVISGWILDPDRKKMSKSRDNNVVTPSDTIDRFGSDAVRYWSASASLGSDTIYDESILKVGGKLVTKIYNASRFVLSQEALDGKIINELDRGFLYELREVVARATKSFEAFEFSVSLEAIERFFWSKFTDNYIELVKYRARSEDDSEGRTSAVVSLRFGLSVLLRMFAPVLPTITEEVWSWAFADETGQKSIHCASWPTVEDFRVDPPMSPGSFQAACEAIAAIRKAKSESGISIVRPLTSLTLFADQEGRNDLTGVINDVAAAGRVSLIHFRNWTPSREWRYSVQIGSISNPVSD